MNLFKFKDKFESMEMVYIPGDTLPENIEKKYKISGQTLHCLPHIFGI